MSIKPTITGDYRKWLLYSFDNQEINTYYDLFKALKQGGAFGATRISSTSDSGLTVYTISHDGAGDDLTINESQKEALAQYLIDNYFHTENVDEVISDKKEQSEKALNYNYIPVRDIQQEESEFSVKPHPKETTYFNIKFTISIIVYLALAGAAVYGILTDISVLIGILALIPVVLFLMLVSKITHGLFIGLIRGNSIRVTKDQFPEIYKIVDDLGRKLKMEELPEILITSGHFNAFVTRFSKKHILMIYSEVVETALKGNDDVLKYVIGHELCHIKQKHLSKKYLFPSAIIPFLDHAYSRGREYTCDRVGYHFSPAGAIEGIMIMTTGKAIHSRFNVEMHIKDAVVNEGFWTWLSEKFLSHPHHYKRLIAIKDFSKYN